MMELRERVEIPTSRKKTHLQNANKLTAACCYILKKPSMKPTVAKVEEKREEDAGEERRRWRRREKKNPRSSLLSAFEELCCSLRTRADVSLSRCQGMVFNSGCWRTPRTNNTRTHRQLRANTCTFKQAELQASPKPQTGAEKLHWTFIRTSGC